MGISLATKYRPTTFEEVCGQTSIVKILERQLALGQFNNCYLFSGPTGCGKTTLARIFANKINKNIGQPIEIDAASNNGVNEIRLITQDAQERSLEGEYKIYIIDEVHMLTSQAWNAFLKCIEEPPMYTIFMFCTTDAQKIPETIKNRLQRFNLSKISTSDIVNRLTYICMVENVRNYAESVDYISKISNGCLREAISSLDKCLSLSLDMHIDNTIDILGNYSQLMFSKLTDAIVDGNEQFIIQTVEDFSNRGHNLKLFVEQYLTFVFDLSKFCMFGDLKTTQIPESLIEQVKYTTGIENNAKYFTNMANELLDLKNMIRYDDDIKTSVEITLIKISRGA